MQYLLASLLLYYCFLRCDFYLLTPESFLGVRLFSSVWRVYVCAYGGDSVRLLPFQFVQPGWGEGQRSEGAAESAVGWALRWRVFTRRAFWLLDRAVARALLSFAHERGSSHCSHNSCCVEVQPPGFTYTCFIPPSAPPGLLPAPAFSWLPLFIALSLGSVSSFS